MAISVMFYGLGPIGAAVARQVSTRKGFRIAGGIDIDPAKIGRDLGEVIELGRKLRVRVTNDATGALKSSKPDVVVLCTSSSLKRVMPQIETIRKARVPIVSTTEELSYPVGKNRTLAKRIDGIGLDLRSRQVIARTTVATALMTVAVILALVALPDSLPALVDVVVGVSVGVALYGAALSVMRVREIAEIVRRLRGRRSG